MKLRTWAEELSGRAKRLPVWIVPGAKLVLALAWPCWCRSSGACWRWCSPRWRVKASTAVMLNTASACCQKHCLTATKRVKGFCQNSGLSRHGGKLTQKLGPG